MKTQLTIDKLAAMRSKDSQALIAINELLMVIEEFERKNKRVATDDELTTVCRKVEKNILQSIEGLKSAGRTEQIKEYEQQLAVVQTYLPKAVDLDELENFIKLTMKENNIVEVKQIGLVMKEVKTKFGASADMKLTGEIVKQNLAKQF